MTTTDEVPSSTRIRTRSVEHVETDRLLRRLEYLRVYLPQSYLWADSRSPFGHRVVEAVNIERELVRRDEPFQPVTDGRHLMYDVQVHQTLRAREGREH